jgi:hypothetical protein
VTIPDSVTRIGYAAFLGCSSLTSIGVVAGNSEYTSQDGVLFDKNKTSIIQYPAGKQNGQYSIPASVTSIGSYAFEGCSSLTSVTIPASVTSIGEFAFEYCNSLMSIGVVDGNSEYSSQDRVLFDKNKTTLIQYPAGKQNGQYSIPASVTSIGSYAFVGCSSLTSVTIPDSVTSIESAAFADCSSLTSVTIPDSVTSIGNYAFVACNSLMSIGVVAGNSEYTSQDGVLFDKNKTTLIQYPAGKQNGHYSISASVTSIGNYAFWECSSLTSVTIPDSVTSIGEAAFNNCSGLTSVTIGNSVTSIGDWSFEGCNSLTSVTIPDSVTSIGNGAFADCSSLTSVTIPDSVTSIGDEAFSGCSSLTSVTIPDSVTSIEHAAFYGCSSLTSVTIGDSVISIGSYAFYMCTSLTAIVFEGNAPNQVGIFHNVSENTKIFIYSGAIGFGEAFGGLPVQILKKKLAIKSFNNHAAPFSLTFETESDSTYKIEASDDLKKWGEIGEVQGTGSSVKFIERRKAMFPQQYYRVKLVE